MKTKRKLLSILMTLAMVVSMIPAFGVTASAASGSGLTESDPRVVTSYEEFKDAMEDPNIWFVKINSLNANIGVPGTSLIAGAVITSTKTLILSGSSTFTALIGDYSAVDSLLNIASGGSLTIKGSGALTFKSNANNASNSVIRIVHNNANVFLYDGIVLTGTSNGAGYGRAIDLLNGNLTIWGGQYYGMAYSKMAGPLSALQISGGNCVISEGTFTITDNSSIANECKPIDVPLGKPSLIICR